MCDFVSWIEKDKKVYFLTHDLVYNTKKGRKLREWSGSSDDYCGHGAIRFYFGMEQDEGRDKEYTDFKMPDRFPDVIVNAIKNEEMRGLGQSSDLLTAKARAEYAKVCDQAMAEYDKVCDQARAECAKVYNQARAEYNKVCDQARAEYDKVYNPARAEYNKVCDQARAEYDKVRDNAFWDLFSVQGNRRPAWRG